MFGGVNMKYDYEELILVAQDTEIEDCADCEYRGCKCKGQCGKITSIYNPHIVVMLKEKILEV